MEEKTVTTSFRIPLALKRDIEAIAITRKRPNGFIIVEALNHYIECQYSKPNGSTKKKAGAR